MKFGKVSENSQNAKSGGFHNFLKNSSKWKLESWDHFSIRFDFLLKKKLGKNYKFEKLMKALERQDWRDFQLSTENGGSRF